MLFPYKLKNVSGHVLEALLCKLELDLSSVLVQHPDPVIFFKFACLPLQHLTADILAPHLLSQLLLLHLAHLDIVVVLDERSSLRIPQFCPLCR